MSHQGTDGDALVQRRMAAENYVRIEELVVQNRRNIAFKETQTYANVIMAVGYAGFIALLNFSATRVSPSATDAAVILFIVSISSFIFNEIFNMVTGGATVSLLAAKAMDLSDLRIRAEVMTPDQIIAAVGEITARGMKIVTQEKRPFITFYVWRICFPVSVFSAVLGAAILAAAYAYQLWQSI